MSTGTQRSARTLSDRPVGWLRRLARLNPNVPWPWRHSIRIAIAVAAPLLVGHFTGYPEPALLVCLGALLNSVKVQSDPYGERLKKIAISAPIAGVGYVLGFAVEGHGPLSILLLMAVGLVSGLISGYGAALSTAAMQMMILAILGATVHSTAPVWMPPLLFMAGGAFAAILLGCEALIDRHFPERSTLVRIIRAMAHLASLKAGAKVTGDLPDTSTPTETARRALTDMIAKGYSELLDRRQGDEGASARQNQRAAILSTVELISFEIIGGETDPDVLGVVVERLGRIADALDKRQDGLFLPSPPPADNRLLCDIDRLAHEIWQASPPSTAPAAPGQGPGHTTIHLLRWLPIASGHRALFERLILGREVVLAAVQLALCIGVALIVERYAPGDRSYWIPLTVAIVLKPDFGSVFVRAVQRSIGTIAGVIIGVVILTVLPKGLVLVAVMTALAAAIPWAGLRGYALQCAFLTPFILVLIDVSMVGPTVDYALQRLVDTVLGATIALVFGYLIWPRSPGAHIGKSFASALQAVANYLEAAGAASSEGQEDETLAGARRAAYQSLSNVRTTLQRALSEPPPASREAAAWFPVSVNAERLCDHIARLAETGKDGGDPQLRTREIAARVAILRSMARCVVPGESARTPQAWKDLTGTIDNTSNPGIADIDFALHRLSHLLEGAC